MAAYYVNITVQSTDEHEVHTTGCPHPPIVKERKYLGDFSSCAPAVTEAEKDYSNVDGCYYCCNECHTR